MPGVGMKWRIIVKQIKYLIMNFCLKFLFLCSVSFLLFPLHSYGCTIFTLTDSDNALFCNSEGADVSVTRIWFIPVTYSSPGERKYGCAFLGLKFPTFPSMWGQGGVNTEGLAYDFVAGFKENWEKNNNPNLKKVSGSSAERMLESCATVEEAIAFYKKYWEAAFSYAKILIADRTGKSVIIGVKDGELEFNISKHSRGFGYGFIKNSNLIGEDTKPTLVNASLILQKSLQEGQYATKYSNVFDLKSGNIYIFRFPHQGIPVRLNLVEELKKGAHYYEIPSLEKQLNQELKSIKLNQIDWFVEAEN